MQILTLTRRKTESFTQEQFAASAEEESQLIRKLYADGVLRQIWRRGDLAGACVIWEAESEQQVKDIVGTLPLYKKGMLELTHIMPLNPYPGFGPRV